jgi:predicted GIY-YIG superfamily endonuclease
MGMNEYPWSFRPGQIWKDQRYENTDSFRIITSVDKNQRVWFVDNFGTSRTIGTNAEESFKGWIKRAKATMIKEDPSEIAPMLRLAEAFLSGFKFGRLL